MTAPTRSAYILQVLEKLAAPLSAAIAEVGVRTMMIPDPAQDGAMKPEAEQMAGLLTKATQTSIGLSQLLDLKLPEHEADSLRLSMTALASPLMANIFRITSRLPNDQEVDRVVTSMSAISNYLDNFAPAGDALVRMNQIDQDFYPSDPHQVTLNYLHALLPVVNSVMAYSFGQQERKLILDVTNRLLDDSKEVADRLFADTPEAQSAAQKAKTHLALLRVYALIYSQCHFAEMAKLMATEEQARQGLAPTMTSLWQAFDLRVQMIEILAESLIPGKSKSAASARSGSSGGRKLGSGMAQKEEKSFQNQYLNKKKASPPASSEPSQEASAGNPANPMSFFTKKKS
jgi:hypothetical protein